MIDVRTPSTIGQAMMKDPCKHPKDYIIFPLDVPSESEAQRCVELLADAVGMFKVGLEVFIRCGPAIVRFIHSAGAAGVFLDLKLHDIPATVSRAMAGVAELGVRLATVHCGETPRMMEAAVAASRGRVGVLGITVLTSVTAAELAASSGRPEQAGDLEGVVRQRARMARQAGCAGVVCSGLEAGAIKAEFGRDFITVTPGIRPLWAAGAADDQRRVTTPAEAVRCGSDYIVIGRPIRDAKDPRDAARRIADEIAAAAGRRGAALPAVGS
ncbi:MAG: orotidine-5'-phosphate decarboxylase [Desulfobacterales bacterium]|nr:orotidine-5'-phosphate decarboxylase [Desulfobacterales bacterium]